MPFVSMPLLLEPVKPGGFLSKPHSSHLAQATLWREQEAMTIVGCNRPTCSYFLWSSCFIVKWYNSLSCGSSKICHSSVCLFMTNSWASSRRTMRFVNPTRPAFFSVYRWFPYPALPNQPPSLSWKPDFPKHFKSPSITMSNYNHLAVKKSTFYVAPIAVFFSRVFSGFPIS